MIRKLAAIVFIGWVFSSAVDAQSIPKPYSPPCMERENVFEFTEKPAIKTVGQDRYEISFAVKGNCDVAVGVIDSDGKVVKHVAAGVLGPNAPAPLQRNSLKQTLIWNGKDDLDEYHKTPDKLRVRVMLGLKPVFDKRLGGVSPHNLQGRTWGVAVAQEGAFVFCGGGMFGHCTVRKFDRDGGYLGTIFPPPASMPLEKSEGMCFIEYEDGKRTRHGRDLHESIAAAGGVMPGIDTSAAPPTCQVAISGNRVFYAAFKPGLLRYIHTDGTTDIKGMNGMAFPSAGGLNSATAMLAASPDGKWMYAISPEGDPIAQVVVRCSNDGSTPPAIFIGSQGKPGSADGEFNGPRGIDCDAQGRIYISDRNNNRIQIFSPEGKLLKSITAVNGPGLIRVHRKTGAMYVQHPARVEGKSVARLSKITSFDNPAVEFFQDGFASAHMALDSWSAKPRLWLGDTIGEHHGQATFSPSLKVFEEDGKQFTLIRDFEAEAKNEAGDGYLGRWGGQIYDRVICDPTREQVYFQNSIIFDLKTGKRVGAMKAGFGFDDMSFDKYGYLHMHFNPCFYMQGVGRVDPGRVSQEEKVKNVFMYPECPYDYGIEASGWRGILSVKDQSGAKGFQDGLGVNMRGEVASECNIYFVPKWEDESREQALAGHRALQKSGVWSEEDNAYNAFLQKMEDARKRGEEVYNIRHLPGIPLSGGTVWTYKRNGELLKECAVIAGELINGIQMDEDRAVYFVNARPKVYSAKPFLYRKAGVIGAEGKGSSPFTATLIKTKPDQQCKIILANSKVPMDPLPVRPPDMMALDFMEEAYMGKGNWTWVEGGEWIYAGAGPVTSDGCSCPRQNLGLDWYKRTYVPEAYRHSVGVLDASGNLIMHLGEYGNFDDAPGGTKGAKAGGTDIKMMLVRFISATDNYLVYGDWGEKLVSLKLDYQAEETVGIK